VLLNGLTQSENDLENAPEQGVDSRRFEAISLWVPEQLRNVIDIMIETEVFYFDMTWALPHSGTDFANTSVTLPPSPPKPHDNKQSELIRNNPQIISTDLAVVASLNKSSAVSHQSEIAHSQYC
jgi:hypothetical protein